jgi:hypothetical protein
MLREVSEQVAAYCIGSVLLFWWVYGIEYLWVETGDGGKENNGHQGGDE